MLPLVFVVTILYQQTKCMNYKILKCVHFRIHSVHSTIKSATNLFVDQAPFRIHSFFNGKSKCQQFEMKARHGECVRLCNVNANRILVGF